MTTNDFSVFCALMDQVHQKAFGEPIATLNYAKSNALSWFIYETTGDIISYKTLINYTVAIAQKTPEGINPSTNTLGILVQFTEEAAHTVPKKAPKSLLWYSFRKNKICA